MRDRADTKKLRASCARREPGQQEARSGRNGQFAVTLIEYVPVFVAL